MKRVVGGLLALVAALAMAQPAAAGDRTLERYAEGTWRSFEAMTDAGSGLPSDILESDGTRSVQTSTTNIGAYMWSAVVAEKLGLIRRSELVARMRRTVGTLEGMERHAPSGQFYNWYDHRTGVKLTTWPPSGEPLTPILSSVDNGWLAVGLKIVAERIPELSRRASALYDSMNFGFYYRAGRQPDAVPLRPGRAASRPAATTRSSARARIAAYIGVAKGEVPERVHFGQFRSFPDSVRLELDRDAPGRLHPHLLRHHRLRRLAALRRTCCVTPSWGGSMFEALMPALFLPEERWGPGSWGANHPLTAAAQIHHGLRRGRLRLLGLLAGQHPGGRLHRLRRRRRSAATRPATRRTTTAR